MTNIYEELETMCLVHTERSARLIKWVVVV